MLLVIFRTQTGKLSALDASCSHLGGDLSEGCVVGERLRCPLHNWEFDVEGICRYIPYGISIPDGARQLSLHCQERYGLVFAFWGSDPSFTLPSFEYGDSALWSRAFTRSLNLPYEVFAAHTFDKQNFGPVQNPELTHPWGGNILLIDNTGTPNNILATFLPIDQDHTEIFITTVVRKPGTLLRSLIRRAMLTVAQQRTVIEWVKYLMKANL
jgi:hypothetical protein